jgi:sulfonate transport system substrate-binding protein
MARRAAGNGVKIGLKIGEKIAARVLLFILLGCSGTIAVGEPSPPPGAATATAAAKVGLQPLGYPAAMIGALLRRDRILKRRLSELGEPLATFAFPRGSDMIGRFADGRLDAGLLGDMPTIILATQAPVAIAGLAKLSATAIVAHQDGWLASIKGKRLAYIPGSSAHYTLLQALASVGLSERDVTLVELAIDDMPAALAQRQIDAFAAWQPAPAIALASDPQARVVFRSLSFDYFVFSRRFVERSPEAADQLLAALVRALEWLRISRRNIETAAHWAMADGAAFSGRSSRLTLEQAVSIARRELIEVPAAPAIPVSSRDQQALHDEFEFLQRLGKLPASTPWERVAGAFEYDGLQRIMAAPARYQSYHFDYRD